MVQRFLSFVETNDLASKDQKIILAVSGGVDSMVMCHIFQQSGFNFGVAHANFQLRGLESELDLELVKESARSCDVQFWSQAFNTKTVSTDQGVSTQMAARDLRYAWLEDLRKAEGFDLVSVAHHLDDTLETILLNLAKGTGISGLRGIQAKVGRLIRPLLFATKDEIIDYAKEQKLNWREDSSNQSLNYQRNLVRAKVVPALKEINPNLLESLRPTLERLRATEELLAEAVNQLRTDAVEARGVDFYISKQCLVDSAGGLILLDQLLKPFGFNFPQVRQVWRQLANKPGRVFKSSTHVLNLDRDLIIVSPLQTPGPSAGLINPGDRKYIQRDLNLEMEVFDQKHYQISSDRATASLDFEKLTFPLAVRPWKAGDRFRPLGMAGQKKLSDFMIDEKIPVNLKKRLFVLTTSDTIAWLIGWKIDDRFKITPQTRNVFRVRYLPQ